jgi:hypothetical protein
MKILTRKKKGRGKRVDPNKLTLKEFYFVKNYCKTLNAAEAAFQAYDVANRNSAAVIGHKLLRKQRVRAAVFTELARISKRLEIDQDKVLGDLESQKQAAFLSGQLSVAVRATELQGRYLGMFIDKIKAGVDEETLDMLEASKKSLAKKLKRLAGESDK